MVASSRELMALCELPLLLAFPTLE
jgi:hypothetical protein